MEESFTVMNPQHSVEAAYTEWVLKAVEIIAQSRSVFPFAQDCVVSRQFALVVSERFEARSKIQGNKNAFFQGTQRILVEVKQQTDGLLVEKWVIGFDSVRDVIPTVRRSERRDITLPRRLAVALRSLVSLTKLMKPEGLLTVSVREERTTDNSETIFQGQRIDLCSMTSSFGNLSLRIFTREGFLASTVTTRDHTPFTTPAKLKIDENFIASHRAQSVGRLGTIEMVVEIDPVVARSAPQVSKSPPRQLSEIWPTSSLSYPVSPGRDRVPSFDRYELTAEENVGCLAGVPKKFCVNTPAEHIFEKPVPVAALTDIVDRIKPPLMINEYLREFEFEDETIPLVKVCQRPDSDLGHAGTVWDAALVLCAFLESQPGREMIKDAKCIELGAGTAIVSIAASRLGAGSVVATDLDRCLSFMKQNIGMNVDMENCSAMELDWDKTESLPEELKNFDWVFCADCVYDPSYIESLTKTILALDPKRGVIVSNERRVHDSNAEAGKQFIKALLDAGYTGKAVHREDIRPDWRCEDIDIVVFEKRTEVKGA